MTRLMLIKLAKLLLTVMLVMKKKKKWMHSRHSCKDTNQSMYMIKTMVKLEKVPITRVMFMVVTIIMMMMLMLMNMKWMSMMRYEMKSRRVKLMQRQNKTMHSLINLISRLVTKLIDEKLTKK